MSYAKFLAVFVLFSMAVPAWGDDVADDVVSGWEFRGVFDVDKTVISEEFMLQSNWNEPEFAEQGEERDIASVENIDDSKSVYGDLPLGRLEVVEEIPYSYPWLKRWQVYNKLFKRQDKTKAKMKR